MNLNYTILYNPLAGNKSAKKNVYKLDEVLSGNNLTYVEMTPDFDYKKFVHDFPEDSRIVLCGGDGTVNRFINEVDEADMTKSVFYYPLGSGNDFCRDVLNSTDPQLIRLNDYINKLPTVTIKGETKKFIDGIGYGIDGYCCEVGDIMRQNSTKAINYTSIAIKGVLFKYKKTNATITVDGQVHKYKRVWLAATMKGRFYGGGMMACPDQDRKAEDGTLSILIFKGFGKIMSLIAFSKIFTGEHLKWAKRCIVLTGKDITVEFDSPRAAQIDGETVVNVLSYRAKA